MGTIVYIVGLVLAVLAVLDIFKKPISMGGKIISSVLVLITSWIGLLVYYLYAKNHLTEWFKKTADRRKAEGWPGKASLLLLNRGSPLPPFDHQGRFGGDCGFIGQCNLLSCNDIHTFSKTGGDFAVVAPRYRTLFVRVVHEYEHRLAPVVAEKAVGVVPGHELQRLSLLDGR